MGPSAKGPRYEISKNTRQYHVFSTYHALPVCASAIGARLAVRFWRARTLAAFAGQTLSSAVSRTITSAARRLQLLGTAALLVCITMGSVGSPIRLLFSGAAMQTWHVFALGSVLPTQMAPVARQRHSRARLPTARHLSELPTTHSCNCAATKGPGIANAPDAFAWTCIHICRAGVCAK